ncbi:hypothetical protein [Nocardia sp. CA-135398]|uniref:hypothetical protein n=1 Tax=Nocardia sp. CA-135398 TaxID=3239977 RepID=UPI003D99C895
MLVVNERDTQGAEQYVLEWIRTWNGQYVIVGLAVSGYPIPDRHYDDPGDAHTDVVVITPRAVVVIEAQDIDADPVPLPDNDPFDLSQLVRRQHPDAFVDRLVVVVPPGEGTGTPDIESRKPSGTAVLGSATELRAWFLRTANRKLIWTAEQTYELLGELGLSHVVTIEELVAEGFPSQTRRAERPASKVLVAASALGAVELPEDARMSSDKSPSRIPYPPWLPPDIDEEPSESVSLPQVGTDVEPRVQVYVPLEPQPVDHPAAIPAPSTPQLTSAFTDRWSSWIESDGLSEVPASRRDLDRRGRPQREQRLRNWLPKPTPPILVATAASENEPRASAEQAPRSVAEPQRWTETGSGSRSDIEPQPMSTAPAPAPMVGAQPVSEPEPPHSSAVGWEPPPRTEPRPLRSLRPNSAPAAPATPRRSTPRLASVLRTCVATVLATGSKLIAGLPQLLATAVVIGVIVATIWLLVSEGMHPKSAVVEPSPESSTEPAVLPQLPAPTQSPAVRCFPFQQQC